jgi:hypothetical protein
LGSLSETASFSKLFEPLRFFAGQTPAGTAQAPARNIFIFQCVSFHGAPVINLKSPNPIDARIYHFDRFSITIASAQLGITCALPQQSYNNQRFWFFPDILRQLAPPNAAWPGLPTRRDHASRLLNFGRAHA